MRARLIAAANNYELPATALRKGGGILREQMAGFFKQARRWHSERDYREAYELAGGPGSLVIAEEALAEAISAVPGKICAMSRFCVGKEQVERRVRGETCRRDIEG